MQPMPSQYGHPVSNSHGGGHGMVGGGGHFDPNDANRNLANVMVENPVKPPSSEYSR